MMMCPEAAGKSLRTPPALSAVIRRGGRVAPRFQNPRGGTAVVRYLASDGLQWIPLAY
jgi:hypothetical protein